MDRLRMRQIGWILSICCIIFMLTACVEVETTMTSDHSITVPAPGTTLLTLRSPSPKNDMYAVAWSPDGRRIASGGEEGTVQVWDGATGHTILSYHGHAAGVLSVAWSPDGKRLASGSWDTTVQVWNATTGHLILRYYGQQDIVLALAWSPDGTQVSSAGDDVRVWQAV